MINEIFHEQYKGQERIEFLEGTHYIKDTSAVLFLRYTKNTSDVLRLVVKMEDSMAVHRVRPCSWTK